LTVAQSLIVVFLLASPLAAQTKGFNKVSADPPATPFQTAPAAAPARREKVFDKKFFIVMGALGGAESFRFTSRKLVIENEYAAGAPWVTSVPSNRLTISKDLGLFSSELLLAYEMKKSHDWLPGDRIIRKLWWVYPAAMTAIHIKNAIGNVRTQGPGGCTSIECAEAMQSQ